MLDDAQLDVDEFHASVMKVDLPTTPQLPDGPAERARQLLEEANETAAALQAGDLVGIVDGCIDTIYVALGIISRCGLDAGPFWSLVHEANMAKEGGRLDGAGKWQKPAGWSPPDIAGELERAGWRRQP